MANIFVPNFSKQREISSNREGCVAIRTSITHRSRRRTRREFGDRRAICGFWQRMCVAHVSAEQCSHTTLMLAHINLKSCGSHVSCERLARLGMRMTRNILHGAFSPIPMRGRRRMERERERESESQTASVASESMTESSFRCV